MIRNYLKIALRNLVRNKMFSFLNILGLTAGTVCCLYILVYVKDQFGYDTHHKDAESIYRVRTIIEPRGEEKGFNSATASPPIAPAMQRDFPEVVAYTRVLSFSDSGDYMVGKEGSNDVFYEKSGYIADSTFFKVFTYHFVEGTPEHSLDEPYTVVLSSMVAKKIFGEEKAINKQIKLGDRYSTHTFKVTGVYDETFGKSHLHPHFIMTLNSSGIGEFVRSNNQWAGQNFVHNYVKLHPDADAKKLEAKLPAFLNKYGAKNLAELGMKKHLLLQKVTDIHLYSKGIGNQIADVSDISFLYLLLTIAGFIQLIACINFVNLTTAHSVKRAKEIGVRKVVGAFQSSLVRQFLGESMIIAFISIFLAIPILYILLPFLNTLTESSLTINVFKNLDAIFITVCLALITGLLSGIYPAFYLSNFKPVSVLKGTFRFKPSSTFLRKGLVVFQFVIAVFLIMGVLIISEQMRFMRSQALGFDQKQRIVIPVQSEDARNKLMAFKSEFIQQKEVKNAGSTLYYPSKAVLQDFAMYKQGGDMSKSQVVKQNRADEDFFKTIGIKILAGRNFTPADTNNNIIVNEKLLKDFKIDIKTAIGSTLYSEFDGQKHDFRIIGVINDYNFSSLKSEITPLLTAYRSDLAYIVAEVQTTDYQAFFANTEKIWKKINPSVPFVYSFLEEDIQKQYVSEKTFQKIINSFTIIAILISCLGLFGLAMFTAEQRTKEIGVRKVLGASVVGITALLSKDFVKLVLIANGIAFPLAYYAMNKWLQDFTYHIDIEWWIFAVAGILAIVIALLTISYQAIKAALMNPVKSLKTE